MQSNVARFMKKHGIWFARPAEVRIVSDLPKTRTGKLLRRLVRARIAGGSIADQDLSSVENPWSLDQF